MLPACLLPAIALTKLHCAAAVQERQLLEATIAELQQQNEELRAGAPAPREGVPLAQPLSSESLAVMRDIETGATSQDEMLMELNEAKLEVQRLTEEVRPLYNRSRIGAHTRFS